LPEKEEGREVGSGKLMEPEEGGRKKEEGGRKKENVRSGEWEVESGKWRVGSGKENRGGVRKRMFGGQCLGVWEDRYLGGRGSVHSPAEILRVRAAFPTGKRKTVVGQASCLLLRQPSLQ